MGFVANNVELNPSIKINLNSIRARPGFEPGTSRTQSEDHTPRPTSLTFQEILNEKIILRSLILNAIKSTKLPVST